MFILRNERGKWCFLLVAASHVVICCEPEKKVNEFFRAALGGSYHSLFTHKCMTEVTFSNLVKGFEIKPDAGPLFYPFFPF